MVAVDNYTTFFRVFFAAIVASSSASISGQLRRRTATDPGEYYALLLLATIGAIDMAAARELITAYLSLELLSFCLYILVRTAKLDRARNEAGMKYMLLGAFSSRDVALRHQPHLRHHRHHLLRRDRGASRSARRDFDVGAAHGPDADHRRPRLQGGGRAVPHVDARTPTKARPLPITGLPLDDSKAAGFALLLAAVQRPRSQVDRSDWRWMIAGIAGA